MGLYQKVGLDVGVVVLGLGQLQGDLGAELAEEGVLLVADGETLVLRCRGKDFQQPLQFRLLVERHAEQLWIQDAEEAAWKNVFIEHKHCTPHIELCANTCYPAMYTYTTHTHTCLDRK